MKLIFIFCVIIHCIIAQNETNTTESFGACTSPNNLQGQCIYLQSCNSIYGLLNSTNLLTNDQRTFISSSQCGHYNRKPLVCCEDDFDGNSDTKANQGSTTISPNISIPTLNERLMGGDGLESNIQDFGSCTTPSRTQGRCVYLQDCQALYQLLLNPPLSQEQKTLLSRSQCGHHNNKFLICCPPTIRAQLPEPGVCGIGPITNRIIGGTATAIDDYPWMALLEYTKPNNLKGFHCGGVLISQRYVLTASHCVNGKAIPTTWSLTGVRLGEWDTESDVDCEISETGEEDCAPPPLNIKVIEKIPHELYNPQSKNQQNDIALLRLQTDVTFSEFVKPICLPNTELLQSIDHVGDTLFVSGWGKTENASASSVKLKVGLDVISLSTCNNIYKRFKLTMSSNQMCAGGIKGYDSCRGDSGGPLMTIDSTTGNPYWYLAGIVSFGPSPCGIEIPGVYTRATSYVNWIESKIYV